MRSFVLLLTFAVFLSVVYVAAGTAQAVKERRENEVLREVVSRRARRMGTHEVKNVVPEDVNIEKTVRSEEVAVDAVVRNSSCSSGSDSDGGCRRTVFVPIPPPRPRPRPRPRPTRPRPRPTRPGPDGVCVCNCNCGVGSGSGHIRKTVRSEEVAVDAVVRNSSCSSGSDSDGGCRRTVFVPVPPQNPRPRPRPRPTRPRPRPTRPGPGECVCNCNCGAGTGSGRVMGRRRPGRSTRRPKAQPQPFVPRPPTGGGSDSD